MRLLFDAEGDGLIPTKLWCISAIDIDTREIYEFGPKEINKGLDLLLQAEELVGHNILGYDLPYIKSIYGVDLYDKYLVDTLVLSRLCNPVQEGGHSLEAWGYRMHFPKVEHEDWSKYTKEMQHRCTMDVRLNLKVLLALEKNMVHFSEECIDLEHEVFKTIYQQQVNGWLFDIPKATRLLAEVMDELGRTEDEVHKTFKPKQFLEKVVTPKLKKDGRLSKQGLRAEEYQQLLHSGDYSPFNRYRTQVFNLSSRQQIGIWLQDFGWKPTKFTQASLDNPDREPQPIVNEAVLAEIDDIPEAALINHYLAISKVKGFLENWLDSVGEDGRQHGYVNSIGAVTGRMTHSKPNLAQVPSSRKPFGKECRSLFIVPEGYKLVGMDAQGLELRMLAHYMDNPSYIETVVSGNSDDGTDAHSVNMRAAGLTNRDQAKTLYYALIYGAGDKKIGSIIGGKAREGKQIKSKLFSNIPELSELITKAQAAASHRGYMKGIDGRLIRVRAVYSALNTLLQGGGAVVMKKALILLRDKADAEGLDYKFVGNIHDEIQSEVKDEDVARFSELALEAMYEAGEAYGMRCPLAGDVKVGTNWSDTH